MAMQLACALAAFAAPEKRWCQAVSKGLLTRAWFATDGANPWLARGLGDWSEARGGEGATSNQ